MLCGNTIPAKGGKTAAMLLDANRHFFTIIAEVLADTFTLGVGNGLTGIEYGKKPKGKNKNL